MLTGVGIPWPSKSHRDAASVAWEGFNDAGLARTSNALTKNAEDTPQAINAPHCHNGEEVLELAKFEEMEMQPNPDNGKGCQGDVKKLECFVERVSDGAPSLDAQANESTGSL
jgi:hypothetical protein